MQTSYFLTFENFSPSEWTYTEYRVNYPFIEMFTTLSIVRSHRKLWFTCFNIYAFPHSLTWLVSQTIVSQSISWLLSHLNTVTLLINKLKKRQMVVSSLLGISVRKDKTHRYNTCVTVAKNKSSSTERQFVTSWLARSTETTVWE